MSCASRTVSMGAIGAQRMNKVISVEITSCKIKNLLPEINSEVSDRRLWKREKLVKFAQRFNSVEITEHICKI